MVQKWKVLKSETVFSAKPFVEVIQEKVETDKSEVVDDFYKLKLRPFALCIPVLENGDIVTIKQYKHGPGEICLTFPAGHIEEGEDATLGCKRELLEETGLVPEKLISLGSFIDNGNQRGCRGYYFLAENCKFVKEPNSGDLEEMLIQVGDSSEIDRAFKDGEILIAHHVLGWLLAKQYMQNFELAVSNT